MKESAITKTKMSRTRQQVIFRIHELRIKANAESHDPPPSYEDSQKKNPSNRNAIKKNPADDNENTSDSKRMSYEQLAMFCSIFSKTYTENWVSKQSFFVLILTVA